MAKLMALRQILTLTSRKSLTDFDETWKIEVPPKDHLPCQIVFRSCDVVWANIESFVFFTVSLLCTQVALVDRFWRSIYNMTCFCALFSHVNSAPLFGGQILPNPHVGVWIGIFKPNLQNTQLSYRLRVTTLQWPIKKSHAISFCGFAWRLWQICVNWRQWH